MENSNLNRGDLLAIERTKLAIERTLLAYFRSFIVFLSSGYAILKLAVLQEIHVVGYFFIIISPILLVIGIIRFNSFKRRLKRYYTMD